VKPLEVFLLVIIVLSVISVAGMFISMIGRKSKNNKVLAQYFEKKIESFKTIKNRSTKKLTEIIFTSEQK
jgi:hypothetical protein